MTENSIEQWVPLSEGARLTGVSNSKVSGLVRKGKIQSKSNPKDERVVLIDLNELKRYFGMI